MIFIEPYSGSVPIVDFIKTSHGPIDIEMYYLASRPILHAMAAAQQRGQPVQVIIDGRPYKMPRHLVAREIARIKATGAEVKVAPPRFDQAFRFDHAKYAVASTRALIGTANWDYSAFHWNREYVLTTSDPSLVQALHIVFRSDWDNRKVGRQPRQMAQRLVLSPWSERRLAAVIDQPGKVDVEAEELGAAPALLGALERKGRDARVILPARLSSRDERNVVALRQAGVEVRELPVRPIYMHAKMIAGDRIGFIGSENISKASLDHNREIGVIVQNHTELSQLRHQFKEDWDSAVQ